VAFAIGGCSDSAIDPDKNGGPVASAAEPLGSPPSASISEFPSKPRIDIDLRASGSFRPGSPISIQANGIGRLPAAAAQIKLLLTDGDPGTANEPTSAGQPLSSWNGSLAAGGRTADLSAVVSFARAGYYRVSAVVQNTPGPADPLVIRDTLVVDYLQRHLWILIGENGGRLTNGFDSTAVPKDVYPMFGSYGPFIPKPPGTGDGPSTTATASTGLTVTGYFRYRNWDSTSGPLTGVPGAKVQATCLGGMPNPTYVVTLTGLGGAFSVNCPAGYQYVSASVLLENSYVNALGEEAAFAGAFFVSFGGPPLQLQAANDYAARVFLDLAQYVPVVFTKFGYTKGQVAAWVSASNPAYGINWCSPAFFNCPGTDLIRSNFQRVFQQADDRVKWDGLFVTLHEYGHSYHWYAVENWAFDAGDCGSSGHGFEQATPLGCAFPEGIAFWISMVAVGSTVDHSPYGGDWGLELNLNNYPAGFPTNPPPPPDNDGVRVEAAVAAFLYDVIDNGTELDGPNNETGTAEPHLDNLAASPNGVLKRLRYCRINGSVTKLSGLDQFVYCLEGNTTAYQQASYLSPAWRLYSTISFEQSVPPINSAMVRAAWEYNLYGIP